MHDPNRTRRHQRHLRNEGAGALLTFGVILAAAATGWMILAWKPAPLGSARPATASTQAHAEPAEAAPLDAAKAPMSLPAGRPSQAATKRPATDDYDADQSASKWQRERTDTELSARVRTIVSQLHSPDDGASPLREVDCRESLCRLVLDSGDAGRTLLERVEMFAQGKMRVRVEPLNGGAALVGYAPMPGHVAQPTQAEEADAPAASDPAKLAQLALAAVGEEAGVAEVAARLESARGETRTAPVEPSPLTDEAQPDPESEVFEPADDDLAR